MLHIYFLGILLCVGSGFALYDSSSSVVDLTPSNFDKLVTDSNEVWLVEFYAPWCGHCKNLVPEYKKTADALKGMVKVGALDADQYKSFAKKYGVTGFPTIKIFTGSQHTPYKGSRTASAMVDACLEALKNKAYGRLGTRPERSSEKPPPETFGHIIQWKRKRPATSHTIRHKPIDYMTTQQSIEQTDNTSETCEPGSLTTEPTIDPTKEIVKMRKPVKTSTKKKRIYRPTTTKATESTIVVDHTKEIGRLKKPLRTPIKKKNKPGQIATNATESTIAVDPSKKIFRMRKPVRTPIKKKNTQRRTTTKATEPTTELTSEPTTELTNEPIIELTTGPTIELANEPTIELTTEPTTMTVSTSNPSLTVIEQFRMLQNQLFRGVIDKDERPKIIKALMRLKYALQGRVVHENATIVKRRSNLRKGLHRL